MKQELTNGAEPIAIVGIGCQYPGIRGPNELWRLLCESGDVVGPMPEGRFKRFASMFDKSAAPRTPGKIATRDGAYFEQIDRFDQGFFGISPREIERMDPQQRLLLEVAWDAIEDAGLPLERISGREVGVYVGAWGSDWEQMLYRCPKKELDLYATTGSGRYALSGRLSYAFNLLGPSMTLDTACSTSLVAVHLACQSLRAGETEMALAGGVNLIMEPPISLAYSRSGMLSPLGRCKFGDAEAKGYVRSEGCALVLLKTLSSAIADGDQIYALVAGSAVNSDGQTGMFVAPSQAGHEALMRQACSAAGIAPEKVSYVEAHGTGTPVGDPVELKAMNNVMGQNGRRQTPLMVGSVKTNLGHSESAAGVTGMIKTALCLHHRVIPPSLYPLNPSPSIPWEEMAITIPRERVELNHGPDPIFAGVNSFGITGTNAHAILSSYQAQPAMAEELETASPPSPFGPGRLVLPLSARGEAGLRAVAKTWAGHLEELSEIDLPDMFYTATSRRTHLEDRLVASGADKSALAASLTAFANGESAGQLWTGHTQTSGAKPVFVFSGQGAHWWAMGRVLYESQPVYRKLLQRIDTLMQPLTGWSVIDELMADEERSQLGLMTIGQPALFALQLGVAAVWRSWGVEPAAVVGHSMGEVTAAVEAGALSLEDGVRVIVHRARVMDAVLGKGTMAATELSPEEAGAYLEPHGDQISIAAINGPKSLSISGAYEAVDALIAQLEADNIFCRKLKVDLPAHSRFMQQASEELTASCREIVARPTTVPIYSTVTGALAQGEHFDAEYWGTNLRQAVQFATAARTIIEDGQTVFLEMNPHPILKVSLNQCLEAAGRQGLVLGSLRREENDCDCMIDALAALHLHGVVIDWPKIYPAGAIVALPHYPWQRERFWPAILDEAESGVDAVDGEAYPWRHWVNPDQPDTDYWQLELTTKSALVRDHRLRDRNVLPLTTLIDMAIQATASIRGEDQCAISNFKIARTIEIKDGQRLKLILSLRPSIPGQLIFKVASAPVTAPSGTATEWSNHAEGVVELSCGQTMNRPDPETIEWMNHPAANGCALASKPELYRNLQRKGCQLPDKAQHLETAWIGEERVLAKLSGDLSRKEPVHLLESACQLMVALAPDPENAARAPIMPVALDSYHMNSDRNRPAAWQSVKIAHRDNASIHCDIAFLDAEGAPVAQMLGLHLATPRNSNVDVRDWFYRLEWQPVEPIADEAPETAEGCWIILAKTQGTGDALSEALRARGFQCLVVKPNEPLPFNDDAKPFNPDDPEDYARVLRAARTAAQHPIAGLINLLNGFMPQFGSPHENTMDEIIIHNCHGMLNLVQAIAAGEGGSGRSAADAMRLFLVTRGAQDVLPDAENLQLAQAPLWGMGKVIQHEHPEVQCRLIDLDPSEPRNDVESLIQELFTSNAEEQVAYRHARRYVTRMVRTQLETETGAQVSSRRHLPVRLTITHADAPFALEWGLASQQVPGDGQVLIQVEAVGLNALDLFESEGSAASSGSVPGLECAGRIVAVGPNVADLKTGDEVVALARNACATFVVANEMLVVKKPEGIGMAEAASLPMAYLNAVVAFSEAVKLRSGQRVLIHKADGPRGAAAVEIAKSLGAEIFATARQPATRDLLAAWGARQVYDASRNDTVDQIMQATHDQGVDVILNLADGEPIEPLLELFPGPGCFVDAVRLATDAGQRAAQVPNRVQYRHFNVESMIEQDPDKSGEYLRSLMTRLFYFKPIPVKVFARNHAEQAFQWMSEGFDTCKFVLAPNEQDTTNPTPVFLPDAGYLITGGLGGLGLAVAQRMVDHGARRIALMGRSEPKPEARAAIEAMERQGARIRIVGGDVTCRDDLADVLHTVEWELGPLRGIMHCAGVLADGVLQQQTWGNFVKVLAPKVRGGWLLHELTEKIPLDFFVMFSSWASVLGSPGQANHSAANAFLDALTAYRRAHGLAAQSINWGPWSDIGVASGKGRGNKLAGRGIGDFTSTEGLRSLDLLMAHNPLQSTVMPFDLIQWRRAHPHAAGTKRFEPIAAGFDALEIETGAENATSGAIDIHDALRNAENAAGRRIIVQQAVCSQLGAILQLDPDRIDLNKPFKFLGLDSLTGLEFRNRLDTALRLSLHVSVVWNYPTITEITGYLLNKLDETLELSDKDGTNRTQSEQMQSEDSPEQMEELLELLDNLSEEDAQRIISGENIHGE